MSDDRRRGQIVAPGAIPPGDATERPETPSNGVGTGIVSQATAIEQARAVAHVQSAYTMALHKPRNERLCREHMLEVCRIHSMAERSFYRYPRSGQQITGMTVHLARELARVWGNIQWGKAELRRDSVRHESEMVAFAVDLETNARVETTFIVPHLRDAKRGEKPTLITDVREVYELLANMGSRREREMIKNILPAWYTGEAEDTCRRTLETGEGAPPLAQRISSMLDAYEKLGVKPARLVQELGKPESAWEARDVASLGITYRSVVDGNLTLEDAFPSVKITSESIRAQAEKSPRGD